MLNDSTLLAVRGLANDDTGDAVANLRYQQTKSSGAPETVLVGGDVAALINEQARACSPILVRGAEPELVTAIRRMAPADARPEPPRRWALPGLLGGQVRGWATGLPGFSVWREWDAAPIAGGW